LEAALGARVPGLARRTGHAGQPNGTGRAGGRSRAGTPLAYAAAGVEPAGYILDALLNEADGGDVRLRPLAAEPGRADGAGRRAWPRRSPPGGRIGLLWGLRGAGVVALAWMATRLLRQVKRPPST
jgi:hypothetical protein